MMESLIQYFETIPSTHRAAILVGGITFFWLWEYAGPLFRFKYDKWSHALVNFFFTLTTIVVNFALAFVLLLSADWVTEHQFGLFFWLPTMPILIYTLLGLMFLDLISAWFAHWIQHKTPWMWKFHLIHHTDQYVDTTTANRHHPGESVIRFFFTTLAVLVLGTPIWLVFLYQSLSVVLSQFNHANISLPVWLDTAISWFIVSPNMHKVHHHYVMPYTDSNYGNIFSVWDRLFGTFKTLDPNHIVFGVDTHMDAKDATNVVHMLKIPAQKKKTSSK
jgi:sterol desaturase/sphingolipid hydroxylase (fatty acid hydroxylase superfamily)